MYILQERKVSKVKIALLIFTIRGRPEIPNCMLRSNCTNVFILLIILIKSKQFQCQNNSLGNEEMLKWVVHAIATMTALRIGKRKCNCCFRVEDLFLRFMVSKL